MVQMRRKVRNFNAQFPMTLGACIRCLYQVMEELNTAWEDGSKESHVLLGQISSDKSGSRSEWVYPLFPALLSSSLLSSNSLPMKQRMDGSLNLIK